MAVRDWVPSDEDYDSFEEGDRNARSDGEGNDPPGVVDGHASADQAPLSGRDSADVKLHCGPTLALHFCMA